MEIVVVDDLPQESLIEKIELLEHDTMYFNSTDKAFEYVQHNCYSIDLMFIDEAFENTESVVFKSGRDLGRKINELFPQIPMILFTGTEIAVSEVVDTITKDGFSFFTNKEPFETTLNSEQSKDVFMNVFNLTTVQTKWKLQNKYRADFFLEYVRTKGVKFREYLMDKAKKNFNWKNEFEYSFKGIKINIYKFFRDRYGKLNQSHSVNIKVIGLLQKTEIGNGLTTIFTGNWSKKNSKEIDCLLTYYNLPNERYIEKLNSINRKSLNYLLDVLRLVNLLSEGKDGDTHYLANKRRKLSVTASLTNDSLRMENFYHKLVGRRVAIACSELLGLDGESLHKVDLAVILRNGNTDLSKIKSSSKRSTLIGQVINTHLGLSINRQTGAIITHEDYILKEELIWSSMTSKFIKNLRAFLDDIPNEIPNKIQMASSYGLSEGFIDLEDFQIFMLDSAKSFPNSFQDLYDVIERQAFKKLNSNGRHIIFDDLRF